MVMPKGLSRLRTSSWCRTGAMPSMPNLMLKNCKTYVAIILHWVITIRRLCRRRISYFITRNSWILKRQTSKRSRRQRWECIIMILRNRTGPILNPVTKRISQNHKARWMAECSSKSQRGQSCWATINCKWYQQTHCNTHKKKPTTRRRWWWSNHSNRQAH